MLVKVYLSSQILRASAHFLLRGKPAASFRSTTIAHFFPTNHRQYPERVVTRRYARSFFNSI